MMKFELGLEKPDPMRALHSAMTIAAAYIVGGLVPLAPYMFIPRASEALLFSVVVTLAALLIFGYAKGYFTGNNHSGVLLKQLHRCNRLCSSFWYGKGFHP
ncbi:vacuolar iron transporter 1-like [Vigna umbellata]|uniref:vacuolar iron transporter 1-like n=1 Tax=Vigna umbellata TaxID=87088 RepID=UPI001F5EEFAF|nr:vacuolar iron transporter 1-like [Vigna umbellata]